MSSQTQLAPLDYPFLCPLLLPPVPSSLFPPLLAQLSTALPTGLPPAAAPLLRCPPGLQVAQNSRQGEGLLALLGGNDA